MNMASIVSVIITETKQVSKCAYSVTLLTLALSLHCLETDKTRGKNVQNAESAHPLQLVRHSPFDCVAGTSDTTHK
jgi:hypothetical protein